MTQEEFSAAFKGSPMKRAKLRGLKRNAAVVLGNVGTPEDVDVLTRALDDPEPLVREHAEWARQRVRRRRRYVGRQRFLDGSGAALRAAEPSRNLWRPI
jgi:hypothetical protein